MGLVTGKKKAQALDRKSYVVAEEDRKVINAYSMSDGSDVSITYYKQIVGENSTSRPFDINLTKVEQQYTAINNLNVKIIDIDDEYKGTMIILPDVNPNVNDLFTMKLFDGRYGLFTITEVNLKDYNLETVYECQFSLLSFETTYLDAIKDKSSIDLYYDTDALHHNSMAIVTANEYENRKRAKELKKKLQQNFKRYYNKNNNRYELVIDDVRYFDTEVSGAFNYFTRLEDIGLDYMPPDELKDGFIKSLIEFNTLVLNTKKINGVKLKALLPSGRYGDVTELLGVKVLDYTKDGDIPNIKVTVESDNKIFPENVVTENNYLYEEDTVLSNVIDTILQGDRIRYNHIKDMCEAILNNEIYGYFYTGLVLYFIEKYLSDRR